MIEDIARYRITDGNAIEYASSLEEAAEIAAGWYDGTLDEPPWAELDTSSLEALEDSIDRWEAKIAAAEGHKDWHGHGSYHVSAAEAAGLNLRVVRD